jgi:hypothetical protein
MRFFLNGIQEVAGSNPASSTQQGPMASIQLGRYEAEEGDLPDVCMRCGAPAAVRKRHVFISHPLWVYVLLPFGYVPYVVVAAVLTERVRCYTHFCPRHKNHWLVRALLIWGSFVALLALIVCGFAVVGSLQGRLSRPAHDALFGMACVGSPVLLFCWLISIPIMQLTAIHPADVTDRRLTLRRVSPAFVEAVRDYRERRRAREGQEDRRPFRPRHPDPREDVFDPERRRQARPNPEAFEGGA